MSKLFFGISMACAALAIFFVCIAIISADQAQSVTANLNWFRVHGSNGNVYYSAFTVNFKYGSVDETFKYSDSLCSVDFCDKCQSNMAATLAFTIMAFIVSVPALVLTILRYTKESLNTRTVRIVCVVLNVLFVFFGIVAILCVVAGCLPAVKNYFQDQGNYDYYYGPSYGLVATALCFKGLETVVSFLWQPSTGGDNLGNATKI